MHARPDAGENGVAMKDRDAVVHEIESTGVVAILRTRSSEQLIDVVAALVDAGLT